MRLDLHHLTHAAKNLASKAEHSVVKACRARERELHEEARDIVALRSERRPETAADILGAARTTLQLIPAARAGVAMAIGAAAAAAKPLAEEGADAARRTVTSGAHLLEHGAAQVRSAIELVTQTSMLDLAMAGVTTAAGAVESASVATAAGMTAAAEAATSAGVVAGAAVHTAGVVGVAAVAAGTVGIAAGAMAASTAAIAAVPVVVQVGTLAASAAINAGMVTVSLGAEAARNAAEVAREHDHEGDQTRAETREALHQVRTALRASVLRA